MDEITMSQMKQVLSQSGIDINNMSKDQLDKIMELASKISNPETANGLDMTEIQNLFKPKQASTSRKKKIKPNVKCPLCDSGKKYKKCCGAN